jgi:hypothetical protein
VTDTYIWVQNGRGDCSIHVIAEGKQLAGCCLDDSFWTAEELGLQPGDVFGAAYLYQDESESRPRTLHSGLIRGCIAAINHLNKNGKEDPYEPGWYRWTGSSLYPCARPEALPLDTRILTWS